MHERFPQMKAGQIRGRIQWIAQRLPIGRDGFLPSVLMGQYLPQIGVGLGVIAIDANGIPESIFGQLESPLRGVDVP